MYRFLDRPVDILDLHHRFLIGAMRHWTVAARQGRCRCRMLAAAFAYTGIPSALPHFNLAMTTINREAIALVRFAAVDAAVVSDDEARLLALFSTALAGDAARARRIAGSLVAEDAVAQLTTAAGLVAIHLAQTIIMEKDE